MSLCSKRKPSWRRQRSSCIPMQMRLTRCVSNVSETVWRWPRWGRTCVLFPGWSLVAESYAHQLWTACDPELPNLGLTARFSRSKEARLVKSKVCFILDAGNGDEEWVVEGGRLSKGLTPSPPDNQWARAFMDRGRELHAETAQSALTVILKLSSVVWLVSSWLF